MLIPVSCSCEGGQVPEWGLVELQGKVEQQLDIEPGQNLPVGSLAASKTQPGVVELTIGYHLLEGKQVPLKKAMAILQKRPSSSPGSCEYEVIGIVRNKYHFKTRPRALISRPTSRQ